MNQNPKKLGRGLLQPNLEFGLNVVDAGEREIVGERAVAGDIKASANLLDLDVVHVDDLWKLACNRFQLPLEAGIPDQLVARLNRCGLTFDMSEDIGNLRNFAAHVRFQFGDLIVSGLQRHTLVEFDVLLNMQSSGKILHADVMNIEVVPRGHGSNAVKDVFRTLRARQRLDRDISVGKDVVNSGRHGFHQLLGTLEGDGAVKADRQVGEITVAGLTDAHPPDFKYSIHAGNGVGDLREHSGRSRVEQRVDRAPRQTPTDGNDDAADEQSGNGIGTAESLQMIDAPQQNEDKAEHNHARGPDVSRKMQRVGFESLALVFGGDAPESP
jgi:hypothetical protein